MLQAKPTVNQTPAGHEHRQTKLIAQIINKDGGRGEKK